MLDTSPIAESSFFFGCALPNSNVSWHASRATQGILGVSGLQLWSPINYTPFPTGAKISLKFIHVVVLVAEQVLPCPLLNARRRSGIL
jgi:hypothetical protein